MFPYLVGDTFLLQPAGFCKCFFFILRVERKYPSEMLEILLLAVRWFHVYLHWTTY